jgi:hypothetical protein
MHRTHGKQVETHPEPKTPLEIKILELYSERVAIHRALRNKEKPSRPVEKVDEALVDALAARIEELIVELKHVATAQSKNETPARPLEKVNKALANAFMNLMKLKKDHPIVRSVADKGR